MYMLLEFHYVIKLFNLFIELGLSKKVPKH